MHLAASLTSSSAAPLNWSYLEKQFYNYSYHYEIILKWYDDDGYDDDENDEIFWGAGLQNMEMNCTRQLPVKNFFFLTLVLKNYYTRFFLSDVTTFEFEKCFLVASFQSRTKVEQLL